ncbi:NAD(P)H-binding protein [Amycolatopsis rifamycinica]|uniref:NmrA family transcriptional regulator n=1 Tax=Amycolatopsis rifamycinica TaxID=287986 RepID=A0A066U5S5_9PSEU|nr:NAD(P)H-binding protein [Amycolatopsis rifamycinica]KDN22806.1 NmrA family transcriptional regulator [Amycolatopsis rifamycinica]
MIMVVGATGNVGKPLVRMLAEAGEEVTAVSRRITTAPPGVVVRQGDLASLDFAGVSAAFLMVSGAFVPVDDVLRRAKAAGVRRVVVLSSQGVATGRHPAVLEDSVRRSGLEWTILQPGAFASNALQWAESVRSSRSVVAPFENVALPVVDPEDIGAVAAAALREDGHAGKSYILTGPAPITPRDQVAAIASAVGEPVRFVPQTREEARALMVGFMPPEVVDVTLDVLGSPTPAKQAVSPDVERVLGRPPRSFAEWASRFAGAFK